MSDVESRLPKFCMEGRVTPRREAADIIRRAVLSTGKSGRSVAKRAGISHVTLAAGMRKGTMRFDTVLRVLRACELDLQFPK